MNVLGILNNDGVDEFPVFALYGEFESRLVRNVARRTPLDFVIAVGDAGFHFVVVFGFTAVERVPVSPDCHDCELRMVLCFLCNSLFPMLAAVVRLGLLGIAQGLVSGAAPRQAPKCLSASALSLKMVHSKWCRIILGRMRVHRLVKVLRWCLWSQRLKGDADAWAVSPHFCHTGVANLAVVFEESERGHLID